MESGAHHIAWNHHGLGIAPRHSVRVNCFGLGALTHLRSHSSDRAAYHGERHSISMWEFSHNQTPQAITYPTCVRDAEALFQPLQKLREVLVKRLPCHHLSQGAIHWGSNSNRLQWLYPLSSPLGPNDNSNDVVACVDAKQKRFSTI